MEEKFKFPTLLPIFAISDNAKNMQKGLNQSLFELYLCNNHTQQLAIMDTFSEFTNGNFDAITMLDASDTCKRLSQYLHKLPLAQIILALECEETGHYPKSIPQANETRWDSRCNNMEGIIYHESCLMRLAMKGKFKVKPVRKPTYSLVPTIEEFEMIKAGEKVLSICMTTTKIFEQEKVPTPPLVVERLYNMDKELEEIIYDPALQDHMAVNFAISLRAQLKEENRFLDYDMQNEIYCMANYLNPTLKGCHLRMENDCKFKKIKLKLEEKLEMWKKTNVEVEEEVVDLDDPEVVVTKNKLSPTELLKQQLKEKENNCNIPRLRISGGSAVFSDPNFPLQNEMKTYKTIPVPDEDTDLLQWWKNHSEQFPLLALLVQVIDCILAASSKSERVFSVAGRVVTPA